MATFIEDGRLIVDDDGVRTDLTDQARVVATALAHLPASIPSARMGAPLFELGQDVANSFGWFDRPDESEPGELRRYRATIEVPINFEILARDEEDAEASADERFAKVYSLIEEGVAAWELLGTWPDATSLGSRYDDTEVELADG